MGIKFTFSQNSMLKSFRSTCPEWKSFFLFQLFSQVLCKLVKFLSQLLDGISVTVVHTWVLYTRLRLQISCRTESSKLICLSFYFLVLCTVERERELSGYTEKQKDYGYIHWGSEKLRNNITFKDRGLAKPKEARYLRMQNNFPGEEQLPTEGGIKKTRFCSYSEGGTTKKAKFCTLVWFLKAVISPSVNAWLCGDDNLALGQL